MPRREHDVFDSRALSRSSGRSLSPGAYAGEWLAVTLTAFGAVPASQLQPHPEALLPDLNRPEILVDLWLPEGTGIEEVEREAKRSEHQLSGNPDLRLVATFSAKARRASSCRSTSSCAIRISPSCS